MSHLDEGALNAVRDGAAEAEHDRHLAECVTCSEALAGLRRRQLEVDRALTLLDEPMALDVAREVVRRRVTEAAAHRSGAAPLPARRGRGWWTLSRAAGLLLLTAAGVSALPGSPVRTWIAQRFSDDPTPTDAASEARSTGEVEVSGIRLSTGGAPYTVALVGLQPGEQIRVRWGSGDQVGVQAPRGSRFTSLEGRLNASVAPGPVEVEIPRGTSRVSLEVDGRIYLRISPQGIETPGPTPERGPDGLVFRVTDPEP